MSDAQRLRNLQYAILQVRAQVQALHHAALYAESQGYPSPLPLSLLLERLLRDLDWLDHDIERGS